jgi:hypothetical protein
MTDFPIFLTERTEFSDELYGVIGRALAFATSFEMNCKAVQAVLGIKELRASGQGEQAIEDLCVAIENKALRRRIDNIIKEVNKKGTAVGDLLEWLRPKLEAARIARNEIAHDVTKGIEQRAEDAGRRAEIIEDVGVLVRTIAEADFWVYNLCQALTNEPTYGGDYCEDAVKWVCEVEYR